ETQCARHVAPDHPPWPTTIHANDANSLSLDSTQIIQSTAKDYVHHVTQVRQREQQATGRIQIVKTETTNHETATRTTANINRDPQKPFQKTFTQHLTWGEGSDSAGQN